jgi:hypothetical protein
MPWCLRLTTGDDVPAGNDLLLVATGWWQRGACRGRDGRGGVGHNGGWGHSGGWSAALQGTPFGVGWGHGRWGMEASVRHSRAGGWRGEAVTGR